MTLPPPPEYAYSQGEEYLEEARSEITLNIRFCGIRGDKNILQSLKFSPWCLAEEAVEQVVPFFLKQDIIESPTTEVETNFMSYSLFLGETYLHKDKSLVELKLEDGANVSLRYEGQNFTLVKVQLPPHLCTANSHFATFKVTPRTPVRSALKRLYLRFCEIHPDVLSYIISGPNPNAHAIDIDSFLFGPTPPAHVNAGNNTPPAPLRLVYRAPAQTDPVVTQRSLALTVIMRTTALPSANDAAPAPAFRTVVVNFNPRDLVAKCVRQLDVVAGALDVFGHYGFYVIPPSDDDGEEHGYWLMENRTLGSYAISPEDTIEYRQHFRSYKIHLLDNTFVFHKFDEHATAKTLLTILIANQNLTSKSPRNFGLYPMPILGATGVNYDSPESALDPVRTLWSYDTILELRFREHLHPITVFFFERTQDTFLVDFSKTVSDLLPVILARFRIVLPSDLPADPSPVSLRKLGGSELDRSRSLRQHGISPGDGLLLKVAIGFESALGLEPSYEMPIYRRPPPPSSSKGPPRGTARVPPPRPSTPSNHTSTNGNKGNTSPGPSPNPSPGPIPTKSLPPVPGDDVNIWEESSSDHVVFDANNKLQAGTLNKLVERLTSETVPDLEFMKAFLMTYQSYTTARKLLSKIFERFRVPSHVEANQKLSIQARVCNVIKYWVEHHYVDFNHHMTQEIVAFTDLEVAESLPPAAKQLRNAVLKRTCDIKHDVIKKSHEDGDLIASLPPVPPRPSPTNAFGKTASLPNLSSVLISPRDSPIASSLSPSSPSPLSSLIHSQSPPSSPPISRLASVTSKAQRTLGVSKEKVLTNNNNNNSNSNNSNSNNNNNLNNSNNNFFSSSSPQSPPSSTSLTTTLSFDKWRSKKNSKERSSSASPTSIWDFDEEEIAQQMTLIDFELYQSIRPTEFLNQAWNKPSTQNRSPNLLALIARSNLVGLWVSHQILREERLRGRAKKMDKLIKVAEHLYNLKNFASVMAFLGGILIFIYFILFSLFLFIHTIFICSYYFYLFILFLFVYYYQTYLISKRFEQCVSAPIEVYKSRYFKKKFGCFGTTRKRYEQNTTPPCMPYLGVHLSDLVFVDEGNPDTINSSKNNTTLVNFSKYHLIHKVISDTLQYQHTTYKTIAPVPFIQSFLRNLTPPLEKDLYAISLLREPRGASKAEIL